MPFSLLSLLFLGLIIDGGFIWFESIKFWRSPILVDGQLLIRQRALKEKPIDHVPNPKGYTSIRIPRSEFKPFKVKNEWITRPLG